MRVVCSRVSRPHIRDDKAGLRREQAPQVPTSCGEGQSERGGAPTLLRQCGDLPAVTTASWEGEAKLRAKTRFPQGLAFHPNFLKQLLFPGAAARPGPPRTPGDGVPEELF